MRALRFIGRYWYVPLLVVGALVGYILLGGWRRSSPPFQNVQRELDAINAGAEVAKVKAELNHQEALRHIDEKYADRLAQLDEEKRVQADRLRTNPEALARFIIRGTDA